MENKHINESILSEEILEDQKKNRIDHMTYLPDMQNIGSDIMDQVIDAMNSYDYQQFTAADVKRALAHTERTPQDFQALLSPAVSGRNRPGCPKGDKGTFWQQCLYVHTDLYCQLL